METLYKLTDQDFQTHGSCQWGEGITHEADGLGELCTKHWLHAYTDPLLAVLLNPIHAAVEYPVLWLAEGEVGKSDHGLKVGCTKLTTLRRLPLPEITREQRIAFTILCAREVCSNEQWCKWAEDWLSGKDRTARATHAADYVAAYAVAAAHAVAYAAYAATGAVAAAHAVAGEIDLVALAHEAVEKY